MRRILLSQEPGNLPASIVPVWATPVQVIIKEGRPCSCSAAYLCLQLPLRRLSHQRLLCVSVQPLQLAQRP